MLAQDGFKWIVMASIGDLRLLITLLLHLVLIASDAFIWLSIDSCYSLWLLMAHKEFMAPAGFQWLPMDLYGSLWLLIALWLQMGYGDF